MFLIELFLPLERGDGVLVPHQEIEAIIARLTDRFGGATAFTQSPAEGLWKEGGSVEKDRIVIVEVMVNDVDKVWWGDFRGRLEVQFQQERILIRALRCFTL